MYIINVPTRGAYLLNIHGVNVCFKTYDPVWPANDIIENGFATWLIVLIRAHQTSSFTHNWRNSFSFRKVCFLLLEELWTKPKYFCVHSKHELVVFVAYDCIYFVH